MGVPASVIVSYAFRTTFLAVRASESRNSFSIFFRSFCFSHGHFSLAMRYSYRWRAFSLLFVFQCSSVVGNFIHLHTAGPIVHLVIRPGCLYVENLPFKILPGEICKHRHEPDLLWIVLCLGEVFGLSFVQDAFRRRTSFDRLSNVTISVQHSIRCFAVQPGPITDCKPLLDHHRFRAQFEGKFSSNSMSQLQLCASHLKQRRSRKFI